MNNQKREHGGIIFQLLLVKLLLLFFFFFVLFMFASQTYQPASGSTTEAADNSGSGGGGTASDEPVDLGTGFLVCVNMPGVGPPKTPALDRRVARRLEAVRADLEAQGIAPLRFTYGFRSTAEQIAVNSGSNYKADPGTSPHEAGRAVDVVGMSVRVDRGFIIATFVRHGWRWLGRGDPPHFELAAEAVGEPDRFTMIRKAQADFARGNPVGCHRGRRGLPNLGPAANPNSRRQRIMTIYG